MAAIRNRMEKSEEFKNRGGIKKDIIFLVISGIGVIMSLFHLSPFPFDMAWLAIIFCGIPILFDSIIGLVTRFDIRQMCSFQWHF